MRKIFSAIICILLFLPPLSARGQDSLANEGKTGLYARSIEQVLRLDEDQVDLATAALIISENWSDNWNETLYGGRYRSRLDEMALDIRDRLEEDNKALDFRAIPVINDYLFDELGFRSISEANDPNSLFLHTVMDRKEGYCLSLSILYLSIGERLGLPLYGVVVPGHFFVRYDDGRVRINIETTSKGGSAPDAHYEKKFNVPTLDGRSIYLRNLTKIQTLGCFFNNLGNSYSDVGNMESALQAFELAVEINPTLSESHANLGNVYLKKGQVAQAIREYQAALNINPNDPKTHNNLGNAYMQQGSLGYAIAEYRQSTSLDPNFVDGYKNLALVYSKQGRYSLAVSELNKAIFMGLADAGCYTQLGDIYSQAGDYESAKDQYNKVVKQYDDALDIQKKLDIKHDYLDARYGLAICYNKLGKVDDEIDQYTRVLLIKPDMLSALVNLGNAYFAQKKYDKAIEQYKNAVRFEPNEPMIYYNLGAAYSNNENYEQAVGAYLKAVAINPSIGDAHYGLAFGYYQLKKYDLAWRHIKIARDLGVEVTKDQLNAIRSRL
jgi:tetratricopeptide (TPR) repeat protein